MSLKMNTSFVKKLTVLVMLLGVTGVAYAQHNMHQKGTPLTEPGNEFLGRFRR